ncbi:alpha/beta hydrolase family protein [Streptomyces koyangensis]|uniref:Alpha/beta hydrolase n=1 Tax=Streptomyces koyangensis TaxID=188770 RepID=A0ABX7ECL4_9ACTN|nr:lipase family protein [Streptomyces koyangensis]QRF02307.1 alpha/beta hydrolase [Streptomyces koyangensis]
MPAVLTLCLLAGVTTSCAPGGPATTGADAFPVPNGEARGADFYRAPDAGRLAGSAPGTVFADAPMEVAPALREAAGEARRIMYRSDGTGGRAAAVTGFLMVPRGEAPEGGWPLVAWAHGTAGVGPRCAPSRTPNLYPEADVHNYEQLVARLLADGYAVVGTDYAGLGLPGELHGYFDLGAESRAVIDSVRAARRLVPAIGTAWAGVGHSQGGHAVLGTGQEAAHRAPELRYRGTAALAPGSHLPEAVDHMAKLRPPFPEGAGDLAAYAAYLAVGAALYAPQTAPGELLADRLAAQMPAAKRLCLGELPVHLAGLEPPLGRITEPGWRESEGLRNFFRDADPARRSSPEPVLLLQGGRDLSVPERFTAALREELSALGDTVDYRTYPEADHDALLDAAYPDLVAWLNSRLKGGESTG